MVNWCRRLAVYAQVSLLSRIIRSDRTITPGGRGFMRLKLVLTGLALAGLAVSSATAAPPAGKGKSTTGPGCKPRVSVILKGTLAAAPSASAVSVNVTSANHWGKAYVGGSAKSIAVTADTKVRGGGNKELSKLKQGFRVLVQARVCKADLANGATPALTATKVIGHDPTANDDNENGNKKDKDDDD
jgi:hypothetical protein